MARHITDTSARRSSNTWAASEAGSVSSVMSLDLAARFLMLPTLQRHVLDPDPDIDTAAPAGE
jgi:hypothetical protein